MVDRDGHILTNNHVVAGAEGINVKLSDEREFKAEVVGTDPETDVALIKLKTEEQIPEREIAKLGDSDKIEVGDWVVAVGNPFGLERTASQGIVSAKGRSGLSIAGGEISYQDFIQTDAAINPGNSGGPLVNLRGEVIGINTAITGNVQGQNFGFAIPINIARNVMEQLRAKGKVVRGFLGILPQEITPDLAEAKGLSSTEGVLVAKVDSGTPAEKGGLKVGDVIIRFAGKKIKNVKQFRMLVANHTPGEKVKMTVIRDGKQKELTFTLGDRAKYLKLAAGESKAGEAEVWMGMEVASVHSDVVRSMGIKEKTGVVVVGVEGGSPAEGKGIKPGDVILQVGQYQIKDLEDYQEAVEKLKGSEKPVLFLIKRGKWTRFVALKEK
ncbi:MAG TPA: Do family serine endopeptidase [Firmicutes bacterium]|nr:Do family serine endopeptidase [Bacillota bacterium]